MKKLRRRVRQSGGNHKRAMQSYTRVDTTPGTSGGAASPPAPGVMPLARVEVYPHPGGTYSTIAYRGLHPIFTSSGEAVPATAPGRWAQLYAAGRP